MTEIPDNFDMSAGIAPYGEDDDDEDLEAELAALARDDGNRVLNPQISNKRDSIKIILDSVIQVEEVDENDGNGDDTDLEADADLMNELQVLTGIENSDSTPVLQPKIVDEGMSLTEEHNDCQDMVALLGLRIENYMKAETNARDAQQNSKVRRLTRGLKTLNQLLLRAQKGESIQENEIPPEVSVQVAPNSVLSQVEAELQPIPSNTNIEKELVSSADAKEITDNLLQMRNRQTEYKLAALECKRNGDTVTAIEFMKVIKRFDTVIKMCEDGQEVDLSDMPPPPDQFKDFIASMQTEASPQILTEATVNLDENVEQASNKKLSGGSNITLIDALHARLNKYKSVEETAKLEGNASKARRFGRIVKQYQEAIAAYKAGNLNYMYDELPVPPGFGPLPSVTLATANKEDKQPLPSPLIKSSNGAANSKLPSSRSIKTGRNINEQQKKILLERQGEYKIAALQAKKLGDIIQAKEFLKICKGFDELIAAANNGLPVDMSSVSTI